MIKFEKPIQMIFIKDYNYRIKAGTVALIDKIASYWDMRNKFKPHSGVAVRVINLWSRSRWFDLGWFGKKISK
jgi:hypothetical protein